MRIATGQLSVNGVSLFSRSVGVGPPDAVVIHGGPSAGHISLLPAIDALARGRRLRYYDQRGCGRSPVRPETPLGWREHLDDLRALIDHWQINEATIVGHSWGALLGLIFAIRHPGHVQRMLLVTPAPVNSQFRGEYLDNLNRRTLDLGIIAKQRELLRSDLRRRHPDEFRKRAFQLSLAPFLKHPSAVLGVEPFRISHRARAAVWRSLGNYDLTDDLFKLSVQALVIHGRHDLIPLSSSTRIAELLGARVEVFENSGHMPFFEEHDLFLEISEEFLRIEDS